MKIIELLNKINNKYKKNWEIENNGDLFELKMNNGKMVGTKEAILFILEEEDKILEEKAKNKKGLNFYIEEMNNKEKNYKYYELMTMMENEFELFSQNSEVFQNEKEELIIYKKIKELRDKKYNI